MTEEHDETTEVVLADVSPGALIQSDPTAALENTEKLVRYMSDRCTGPKFVSSIQGRLYPKVEWWTTVGMTLGLLPVEVSSKRIDFDGGYMYEAVVEVRRGDQVVTRASAICSTAERAWGRRDEYAVKSMAATRATGKAYRIGLSALAVMAGLEATPADEIPPQGFGDSRRPASAPQRPVQRKQPAWMTPEYHEAADALKNISDDGDKRLAYVCDVIGRTVEHPQEVSVEEWVKVKESAVNDALNMMEAEGEA